MGNRNRILETLGGVFAGQASNIPKHRAHDVRLPLALAPPLMNSSCTRGQRWVLHYSYSCRASVCGRALVCGGKASRRRWPVVACLRGMVIVVKPDGVNHPPSNGGSRCRPSNELTRRRPIGEQPCSQPCSQLSVRTAPGGKGREEAAGKTSSRKASRGADDPAALHVKNLRPFVGHVPTPLALFARW